MRLSIVCAVIFCAACGYTIGQNSLESKERIRLVTIEGLTVQQKIANIKFSIEQIENKIIHIKNDPLLLAEAQKAGTLLELHKQLQASEEELKLLQKK